MAAKPVSRATSPIISLAWLKVLWDKDKRDYLANFVPMVAEVIRQARPQVISVADVQSGVATNFGLTIPQHSLNAILKRLQRKGYIRLDNHAYYPVYDRLAALNIAETQRNVERLYDDLIRDLVAYVGEAHKLGWTSEEAEAAFLDQLRQRTFQVGVPSQSLLSTIPDSGRTARYYVAAFIERVHAEKSTRMRDLSTVMQGYMLANALFLPDVGAALRKFRGTDIYFDTPFLLFALGYSGPSRQSPCTELLKMLYETGANLRCFRHTHDEARGALEACAGHIKRGADANLRGPAVESIQYFLSEGYTASDIEQLAARLDDAIAALRISIVDRPPYSDHDFVIDEAGLGAEIKEHIPNYREVALERDVDSIAAVMRARAGKRPTAIEDCRAVLVTNNGRLVRIVREYFQKDGSPYDVPPSITDFTLTNLIWLKHPTGAPDLPTKRLIADCYAVLQPDEELWQAFEAEVKKLRDKGTVTTDDYYELRYSLSAKTTLMDLTAGEPDAFTEGTVIEVLKHVQETREAAAIAKVAAELTAARSESRSRKAAAETQRLRLGRRAQLMAWVIARTVEWYALIALIVVTFVPLTEVKTTSRILSAALAALPVLVAALGVASLTVGATVRGWTRRLEDWLSAWLVPLWFWIGSLPPEQTG